MTEAIEALRSFVDLLRREQAMLTEGDIDALPPLTAEKTLLADRLNRMPHSQDAAFLELAAQVRALNETNGSLIALRMRHNQQALSILMAAADPSITYGPDGQPRTGGSRSFGRV